jgi:hypothetical protein
MKHKYRIISRYARPYGERIDRKYYYVQFKIFNLFWQDVYENIFARNLDWSLSYSDNLEDLEKWVERHLKEDEVVKTY